MTGWEIDELVETDRNFQWEIMNEPDPDEGRYVEAAGSLDVAMKHLDKAYDWIDQAISDVEGLKAEDEIIEQYNKLDDFKYSIKVLIEKLRRGDAA